MADMELDESPESTWGASDEYKAAWHEKYGNVSPKAGASKAEWEEFATKNGMSAEEAADATRAELVERFGAETVVTSPSAPNDTVPGQGAGKAASPSPGDPAVKTATGGTRTR
jgi:hypothetical protein